MNCPTCQKTFQRVGSMQAHLAKCEPLPDLRDLVRALAAKVQRLEDQMLEMRPPEVPPAMPVFAADDLECFLAKGAAAFVAAHDWPVRDKNKKLEHAVEGRWVPLKADDLSQLVFTVRQQLMCLYSAFAEKQGWLTADPDDQYSLNMQKIVGLTGPDLKKAFLA
jgi:hypothetical protein